MIIIIFIIALSDWVRLGNVTCGGVECLLSFDEHCRVDVVTGRSQCLCPSCPAVLRPTCGSDGRTYGSQCELRRQACLSRRRVSVAYIARCGLRCAVKFSISTFHKFRSNFFKTPKPFLGEEIFSKINSVRYNS